MIEDKKISIYCCYHDRKQLSFKLNDDLIWYYGPYDPLNKFLSEFSLFKYVYNNDKNSDIIGLCHYRRQLLKVYTSYVDNEHCIVLNKNKFDVNIVKCFNIYNWSRSNCWNCEFMYDCWIEFLLKNNIYDKYYFADNYIQDNNIFLNRSCVVLDRNHFIDLYKYVFGVFDYIDNKYNLNHDPDKYQEFVDNWKESIDYTKHPLFKWNIKHAYVRLFAYFGEYLVSNYICANYNWDNIFGQNINRI